MPKLEIIVDSERQKQHIDVLRTRYPVEFITRSSFYVIVGCYVPGPLTDLQKEWLIAMKEAHVIQQFRCKEREDR
jgi:hypothetical protein